MARAGRSDACHGIFKKGRRSCVAQQGSSQLELVDTSVVERE
jgi:hypothetical protein